MIDSDTYVSQDNRVCIYIYMCVCVQRYADMQRPLHTAAGCRGYVLMYIHTCIFTYIDTHLQVIGPWPSTVVYLPAGGLQSLAPYLMNYIAKVIH